MQQKNITITQTRLHKDFKKEKQKLLELLFQPVKIILKALFFLICWQA
tara:strand:+ start:2712 stop:2855 length:144 start_codon:yes stop_codon:yes gene_type:complete